MLEETITKEPETTDNKKVQNIGVPMPIKGTYQEWLEQLKKQCKEPDFEFEDRFILLIGFLKDSCLLLEGLFKDEETMESLKPGNMVWFLMMMEYSLDEIDVILYEMLSRLPVENKQTS